MSALLNPAYLDHDGAGRRVAHPALMDRTVEAVAALTRNPQVIAELVLSDEECAGIGRALECDDSAALMRVYRAAMDRHVQELIDGVKERSGNPSDYDAALSLSRIYA